MDDVNYNLCGSYCLYSFFLTERMNYFDTVSKMFFDTINAN